MTTERFNAEVGADISEFRRKMQQVDEQIRELATGVSVEINLALADFYAEIARVKSTLADLEADKIRIWEIFESTKFRYMEKGVEMDIHCSAGVVFCDEDVSDFEELYARADKAMYQAKGAGRNTIVIA